MPQNYATIDNGACEPEGGSFHGHPPWNNELLNLTALAVTWQKMVQQPRCTVNKTTGVIRTFIATEAPTMPREFEGLLQNGEQFVPSIGHAEQTVLNSLATGRFWRAVRPVTSARGFAHH
jgi:hypothetical protein